MHYINCGLIVSIHGCGLRCEYSRFELLDACIKKRGCIGVPRPSAPSATIGIFLELLVRVQKWLVRVDLCKAHCRIFVLLISLWTHIVLCVTFLPLIWWAIWRTWMSTRIMWSQRENFELDSVSLSFVINNKHYIFCVVACVSALLRWLCYIILCFFFPFTLVRCKTFHFN